MIDVDKYLGYEYHPRLFNCAQFACLVWAEYKNIDFTIKDLRNLRRIYDVTKPCFILMHRKRESSHIGIYIKSKVLHLNEKGVEYLPIEVTARGFSAIRFYA